MKNEFITINGKLDTMTKKDAKEKIIKHGGNFQQDINSKTTLVIIGKEPLKKKYKKIKELEKNGQLIKTISEEEFINILNPKKNKEIPKFINKNNILRIVALLVFIILFGKMNTLIAKTAIILAAVSILPKLADKYYNHIVFKIVIPATLIMFAFTFNNDTKLSQVYGLWYIDTLTLNVEKEKTKIDVIDKEGRHILDGKTTIEKNKIIVKTDYKTYHFEYDNETDSLCYLKDGKNCQYYLKRIK